MIMIYSLENEKVKITISDYGAELHSIIGKKRGTGYLWNGDLKYWKYRAPHLFPIVGKLVDDKYKVDGKEYELPAHGFARISQFRVVSKSYDSITFELKYSDRTLLIYPFKFLFQVIYQLKENKVNVIYKVINLDEKEIYFSLGAHPALMCPIEETEKFEDYYIRFNKHENSYILCFDNEKYFVHDKKKNFMRNNIIKLRKESFKNEALVFDDLVSDQIVLQSSKYSVRIEWKNFPNIAIWSPANDAPFVCIEPWLGHADYADFRGEFKDKEGVVSLPLSKEFECNYIISIDE